MKSVARKIMEGYAGRVYELTNISPYWLRNSERRINYSV